MLTELLDTVTGKASEADHLMLGSVNEQRQQNCQNVSLLQLANLHEAGLSERTDPQWRRKEQRRPVCMQDEMPGLLVKVARVSTSSSRI